MLTMTKIKNIRKLYFLKGQNIRSICKSTGHDYRTVVKYLNKNDFNEPDKSDGRGRPRKIDTVIPIIDKWLEADKTAPIKQRHTAKRIFDRLRVEHPDLLDVSYRTVAVYVSRRKKEIYKDDGYLPLDHPMGEAQADFGQAVFYEKGKQIQGHYLNLSFPYSNGAYTQVFKGENQECLLEGLKRIFERIGHVPYKIWFDNLSAAVILGKNKERSFVEQFERFALHYKFQANFCNPNSGHEKGNVENKVGYIRRNMFVPIPHFDSIDKYNESLFDMAELDMKRKHYKKDEFIIDLLEEEKSTMYKLPDKPFEVCRIKRVIADKYGKVEFETNKYSSSPSYSSSALLIKATAKSIVVMNAKNEIIVVHDRIYDKCKESMKWCPYLEALSKRPNAIKYVSFINELPPIWRDYILSQDKDARRESIKALKGMLESDERKGLKFAEAALYETIDKGLCDIDSVITTYYRLKNNTATAVNELNIKSHVPRIIEYKSDISIYDSLYEGKVKRA
jgi:transposase